ncbi:uncharacterized protein ASPGLDRAFT_78555 [Aspergillus glaucus CBS 516.65]|uniref:Uncharacterized protein n=1 Tax=Aspergillus glaucus CBS 516.65 TaxID=1160497 RepID=A0A1L9VZN3_ASPGL|nr:hypothetical protein ASPGLDRAFT_78555 [Aspergillus glaucus CBS 516.65]OJJ89383.1 hypothetical protein ASPGLDRAFT_78555 [Aspergillus glaucus CBS 516.65]
MLLVVDQATAEDRTENSNHHQPQWPLRLRRMMIVSREKSEIHPLANKITSLCPGVCLAARTHNSSRKRKDKKKLHPLRTVLTQELSVSGPLEHCNVTLSPADPEISRTVARARVKGYYQRRANYLKQRRSLWTKIPSTNFNACAAKCGGRLSVVFNPVDVRVLPGHGCGSDLRLSGQQGKTMP